MVSRPDQSYARVGKKSEALTLLRSGNPPALGFVVDMTWSLL